MGCNSPDKVLINVVFPAPFLPKIPTTSPLFIFKEIDLSASKFSYLRLKKDFIAPFNPASLLNIENVFDKLITCIDIVYKLLDITY